MLAEAALLWNDKEKKALFTLAPKDQQAAEEAVLNRLSVEIDAYSHLAGLKKLEAGSPTKIEVKSKSSIGAAWLPAMVMNYSDRLSKKTTLDAPPRRKKTVAERRAETAQTEAKLSEYKRKFKTYAQVCSMNGIEMKSILQALKVPNRRKLSVRHGTCLSKLCEVLTSPHRSLI